MAFSSAQGILHLAVVILSMNASRHMSNNTNSHKIFGLQLKSRCEELKLDWGTLCLESLLKEKQALRRQISEKQRHCLELQVQNEHCDF